MKFHWGDFLHRDGGHWQIVPNAERGKYWSPEPDCASFPQDTKIATVSRNNTNFEALQRLESLEELTLHETNQAQIDGLVMLPQIKRLRITHARPKNLDALASLSNVEELVLEYVSGFSDLSPVGAMPKLRSLHIENLRRVTDFSPLGGLSGLQYLDISGTFDFPQPIDSVDFASELKQLDYLFLMARLDQPETAKTLVAIGDRCSFNFAENLLPLEIFAYLEAHCAKAEFTPSRYCYLSNPKPVDESDPRATLSVEEIGKNHPEILLCDDGRRLAFEATEFDKYIVLGRGARDIGAQTKNAAEKAAAYEKKYYDLVAAARAAGP